jgi:hypothetical protein
MISVGTVCAKGTAMRRSKAHHALATALKKVALLIVLCVTACGITPSHVDIFKLDAQRYGNGGS